MKGSLCSWRIEWREDRDGGLNLGGLSRDSGNGSHRCLEIQVAVLSDGLNSHE